MTYNVNCSSRYRACWSSCPHPKIGNSNHEVRTLHDMKVAVVGCGGRGKGHIRAFGELEDTDVVAVCDVDCHLRHTVGDELGIEQRYSVVDEMLDAEMPDVVVVAVPAHLNAKVALPILNRGFNTLVEKPPGMSVVETTELRDAAAHSGAEAMVGWQRRFHPIVVRALEMVEARGPVTQVVGEFHKSISQLAESGRFPQEVLDNMVFETPIHSIDLVRTIAGSSEVAEVHSIVRRSVSTYKDVHAALVLFENGCVAQITANYTTDARLQRYEIHGQDISAYIEGITEATICVDGKKHQLRNEGLENDTTLQARFFMDCLRGNRPVGPPAANLDEAIKTMELAEAILAGLRD